MATNTSNLNLRPHQAVWFEIPASDLNRAVSFYEALLGIKLMQEQFGPVQMAIFPYEKPNVGGCIAARNEVGGSGPLLFLNADPSLDDVLGRVAAAGGEVVQPRFDLPPGMGAYAKIRDTEGNVVGIHALA